MIWYQFEGEKRKLDHICKNKLCKACLVHPGNTIHEKYRTYKNIFRKCLKEAEIKYHEELFDNHKIRYIISGNLLILS